MIGRTTQTEENVKRDTGTVGMGHVSHLDYEDLINELAFHTTSSVNNQGTQRRSNSYPTLYVEALSNSILSLNKSSFGRLARISRPTSIIARRYSARCTYGDPGFRFRQSPMPTIEDVLMDNIYTRMSRSMEVGFT